MNSNLQLPFGPGPQQPDPIPELANLDGMWTDGVSSPPMPVQSKASPAAPLCPPSVLQALDQALDAGIQTGRVRPGEASSSVASSGCGPKDEWHRPPNLRYAEHLFMQGDVRLTMENALRGANGNKFKGTWDELVAHVNKGPQFIGNKPYEEGDLLAAWRRGNLSQMKTRWEKRLRGASPRLPRLVSAVAPVPRPAVISTEVPKHFLEGATGFSVGAKDSHGRSISTSLSAVGLFQQLHKEEESIICQVFEPAA